MLTKLLKAIYARILAHYMQIHPQAAYHLINTTLNYGRLPTPGKTGGIYQSLTIRRHQTTIIRGGRHDLDNIDFAHRACNTRKRDKTLEEYRAWQAR